ncbi:MAG TPA: hypothetical protein PLX06_14530 [Fimbriimonadaceae bacterium]|nr:hypothetical protein [Fimbriimonadaceae bacterium]
MYEHKSKPPIPIRDFQIRVIRHLLAAFGVIGSALGIGIVGYHWIAGLDWIDSLLEASMILGGMGPIQPLNTTGAKLFASFYSLFSGLAFIGIAGVMIAPVAHRILHRFHWEETQSDGLGQNRM